MTSDTFDFVLVLSDRFEQRVRIDVTDVNDELPRFVNTPRPFLATVATNAPPGTSVFRLEARDPDSGSVVRYNLESGEASQYLCVFHNSLAVP